MATLPTIVAASPMDADDGSYLSFTAATSGALVERDLGNTPADFGKMDTVSFTVTFSQSGRVDDQLSLYCRVRTPGSTYLAAASSAGGWSTVQTLVTSATDVTVTASFAYVNTNATKADWDSAVFELRQTYSASMANDGAFLRVDYAAIGGTYTQKPDPPTSLTATGDTDSINLSWTAPGSGPTPTSYTVYRTRQLLSGDDSTFTSGIGSWATDNASTVAHNSTEGALDVTATTATGGVAARSGDIGATVGYRYVASAKARDVSLGTPEVLLALTPYTSGGSLLPGVDSGPGYTTVSTTGYTTVTTATLTAPSTTAYVRVRPWTFGNTAIGQVMRWDDVTLAETAVFSGITGTTYDDTTAAADTTYTYTVRSVNGSAESTDSNTATGARSAGTTRTATAADLSLTAQSASRTPGAVSRTATAAALTLTAQTASRASVISRTATAGALTLTAQSASASVGAVTRTATAASLTLSGQTATRTIGSVARTATAASLTLTAQSANRTTGVTRSATAAGLTLTAQAATASPGAVSRTATAASLTLGTQTASRTPGAVSRVAATASLTLMPSGAVRAVGALNRPAGTTTLTLSAQAATAASGPVSRTVSAASLALTAQTASASPGAVSRTAAAASLTLTAQAATASNSTISPSSRTATAASLTLAAQSATGAPGAVTRTATAAALTLTPASGQASVGAVARTAAPAALVLTAQAATRSAVVARTAEAAQLTLSAQAAGTAVTAVSRTATAADLVLTAAGAQRAITFPVTYPDTVLVRGRVHVHLAGGIYL